MLTNWMNTAQLLESIEYIAIIAFIANDLSYLLGVLLNTTVLQQFQISNSHLQKIFVFKSLVKNEFILEMVAIKFCISNCFSLNNCTEITIGINIT